MDLTTRIYILDGAIFIFHTTNTQGMNTSIPTKSMSK